MNQRRVCRCSPPASCVSATLRAVPRARRARVNRLGELIAMKKCINVCRCFVPNICESNACAAGPDSVSATQPGGGHVQGRSARPSRGASAQHRLPVPQTHGDTDWLPTMQGYAFKSIQVGTHDWFTILRELIPPVAFAATWKHPIRRWPFVDGALD
jgi:hypothetical protein